MGSICSLKRATRVLASGQMDSSSSTSAWQKVQRNVPLTSQKIQKNRYQHYWNTWSHSKYSQWTRGIFYPSICVKLAELIKFFVVFTSHWIKQLIGLEVSEGGAAVGASEGGAVGRVSFVHLNAPSHVIQLILNHVDQHSEKMTEYVVSISRRGQPMLWGRLWQKCLLMWLINVTVAVLGLHITQVGTFFSVLVTFLLHSEAITCSW